jgi:hypothetical protein
MTAAPPHPVTPRVRVGTIVSISERRVSVRISASAAPVEAKVLASAGSLAIDDRVNVLILEGEAVVIGAAWVDKNAPDQWPELTTTQLAVDPPAVRAYYYPPGPPFTFTRGVVRLDRSSWDWAGETPNHMHKETRLYAPVDGTYSIVGQVNAKIPPNQTLLVSVRDRAGGDMDHVGTAIVSGRLPGSSKGSTFVHLTTDWQLTAGAYIEMFAEFPSKMAPTPGAENTFLQMRWVAPSR